MMKSVLLSVACLVHSVPVLAQAPNLSGSPSGRGAKSGQSNTENRQMRRLHETTTTGCLLGQDGKYTLITSKPSSVLQLVAAPNLEAQVGHKVKITGTIEDAPSAPPTATASPAETNESQPADIPASGQLKVRKLKMISAVCDVKTDKQKSWIHMLSL
jgi:hypothetical protein